MKLLFTGDKARAQHGRVPGLQLSPAGHEYGGRGGEPVRNSCAARPHHAVGRWHPPPLLSRPLLGPLRRVTYLPYTNAIFNVCKYDVCSGRHAAC